MDPTFDVSQESILGLILFNGFLCDMFLFSNNVKFASYADNNRPCYISNGPEDMISKLKEPSKIIFKWLKYNNMNASATNSYLKP